MSGGHNTAPPSLSLSNMDLEPPPPPSSPGDVPLSQKPEVLKAEPAWGQEGTLGKGNIHAAHQLLGRAHQQPLLLCQRFLTPLTMMQAII